MLPSEISMNLHNDWSRLVLAIHDPSLFTLPTCVLQIYKDNFLCGRVKGCFCSCCCFLILLLFGGVFCCCCCCCCCFFGFFWGGGGLLVCFCIVVWFAWQNIEGIITVLKPRTMTVITPTIVQRCGGRKGPITQRLILHTYADYSSL